MILIETQNFKSFDEYLSSLKKSARKNWRYAKKHNKDLTYKSVDFQTDRVDEFMKLWASQLVRGNPIEWAFPIGTVEDWWNKGELLCFDAGIAYHFVQRRANYLECHPPMYDKKYNDRYLAKYMWFNLIKYAIENKLGILNFGGGDDRSWQNMIRNRDLFPNPKYKWIYVPKEVKQFPEKQIDYYLENYMLHERLN